jgi:hypothetical protein
VGRQDHVSAALQNHLCGKNVSNVFGDDVDGEEVNLLAGGPFKPGFGLSGAVLRVDRSIAAFSCCSFRLDRVHHLQLVKQRPRLRHRPSNYKIKRARLHFS